MHASSRGGSSFALEALERRELLSFDPSKVGAIWGGAHSWKAQPGAADYFLENSRIGYMTAALSSTLPPTSYAKGGDPWSYVSGGRYQLKNGAGVAIGTLTLRNVQSTHVTVERYWADDWDESGIRTGQKGKWNGVHTDGIYIENLKGLDPDSVFVFEDVDMTEISGGQGILWEKGSAKRIFFRDVHVANRKTGISGRIMLKVDEQTRFDELIFDDVTANVIFMVNGGRLSDIIGKVFVHDLSASQRDAIRAALERKGFPVNDPTRFVTRLPDDLVDSNGVALARPYRGEPVSVGWTTTVEAEEYDNGQEGLAYHDTTADTGDGGQFRSSAKKNDDAVDTFAVPGGRAVRMVAGEWMDYTIDVRAGAMYDVRANVISQGGGTYRVEFDGIRTTRGLDAGESRKVYLPAGRHVMRLVAVAGTLDIDGIELARRSDRVDVASPVELSARSTGWGALDGSRATLTYASVNNLTWRDVDGEQEYVIERRTADEGKWERVGTAAADVTGFADAGQWEEDGDRVGIQPKTTYHYRVVAVDDAGQRNASEVVRLRTGAPIVTAAPRQPLLLSVKVSQSGAVQLKWADRSDDERGFRVERSTDPSFGTHENDDGSGDRLSYDLPPVRAGTTAYVDRGGEETAYASNHQYGLRPGQTYYYRITAYNSFGQSRASEIMSVKTPDVGVPGKTRNVSAGAHETGCGVVVVKWAAPASGDAVGGYRVERRREGSWSSWHVLGNVDGGATEFMDYALRTSNLVSYEYRVVAFNVAGDGQPSDVTVTRAPKSGAVSDRPADVDATAFSTTAIRVSWDDRSSNEAGFRIERSMDGINWNLIGSVTAGLETFDDHGLVPRTAYYYRVSAFNTNDTEAAAAPSAVAKGKTPAVKKLIPPNPAEQINR
jgi:hypothetical protein